MGCQFWLNEDGELIADDNGAIMMGEDCPCGSGCCERLAKQIASILRQTVQYCVPCDQLDWNVNCGECEIIPPNQDPENPLTQLGEYVTKRRNRIISFTCDTGFQIKQPEGGEQVTPQEGDIVTVTFCDGYEATTVYSASPSLTCYTDEPCCIFTHVYCQQGDEDNKQLYPVLVAPDYPSIFSSAQGLCEQKYWRTCFQTTPVAYVTCAAQVIAPRCWFDDYVQGSAPEPDYTPVWGVIGCFCEGNDKWQIKAIHNGGAGLIVVDTPFVPEKTDKLDEQGNPVLDEHGNKIPVIKCAITCDGSKDMVKEMIEHYQAHNPDEEKSGFRITTDMNKWQEWTGEVRHDECFFGFIPVSFVTFYECYHYNENNVYTRYHHIIMFDCNCNLTEDEVVWQGGGFDSRNVDIYPSDVDVCNMVCPALWAMVAYANGTNMNHSTFSSTSDGNVDPANPNWSIWPPRTSGEGGVILSEDSRASGQGIYTIGGSPCIYAAWDNNIMLWIGCECDAHVECMRGGAPKKFIESVDPCICVDFRELVDDNPTLFGVVDKKWGSHALVQWSTTNNGGYSGPYWIYNGSVQNCSHDCPLCDTDQEEQKLLWDAIIDPFIDYNMLLAHRIVNGAHEFGHVNKAGGISNYRLSSGSSTQELMSASFGIYNDKEQGLQYYPYIDSDPLSASSLQVYVCHKDAPSVQYQGWYIYTYNYVVHAGPYDQPECSCEPEYDYLPICKDHSLNSATDTIFFTSGLNLCLTPNRLNYQINANKRFVDGHYVYVRNQTSCQNICVRWEPGRTELGLFMLCAIRTSCGLMIQHQEGIPGVSSSKEYFIRGSLEIPSVSSIENKWGGYITRHWGYLQPSTIDIDYPASGGELVGARYETIRNSRGTLLSYIIRNAPSGSITHDPQAPLCHKDTCDEKLSFNNMEELCAWEASQLYNPSMCKCELAPGDYPDECVKPTD